jgi:hypothetical protein
MDERAAKRICTMRSTDFANAYRVRSANGKLMKTDRQTSADRNKVKCCRQTEAERNFRWHSFRIPIAFCSIIVSQRASEQFCRWPQ